jgi:hypothetical protein
MQRNVFKIHSYLRLGINDAVVIISQLNLKITLSTSEDSS